MFYRLPHPWDPGYAIPDYVRAEPPGRGVHFTKYLPRKTIDTLVPEYLGDVDGRVVPGSDSDPIAMFGKLASSHIMGTIYQLPPAVRKGALKSLFTAIDPKLWRRVASKAARLQRTRAMDPAVALEKAIASSMSMGLLEEFVRAGRKGRTPPLQSLSGLGAYGDAARTVVLHGYLEELGGLGKWLKNVAKAPGRILGGIAGGAGAAGGKAYSWGKSAIDKIGDLACGVAKNPIGQVAAGAGAGAMGAPPQVGVAGAQIVGGMCKGDKVAPGQQVAPPSGMPGWVLPAAIGGGALMLVLVLKK